MTTFHIGYQYVIRSGFSHLSSHPHQIYSFTNLDL